MSIRRRRRGRLRAFGIAVVVLATAAGGLLWLAFRDPESSLPRLERDPRADRDSVTLTTGRKIQHFVLHTRTLGDIGIVVSLPEPLPRFKLPILVVLGGLGTGEENIRYVPDAGDNAVVGYDWPMPRRIGAGAIVWHLPDLYRRVMSIPGQVGSAMGWLTAQPWADGQSVSILGYSLGAIAAPAIEDMAERDGQKIGWTILAYGGDPLGALVAGDPRVTPRFLRPVLAPAVDILLSPLEPDRHLPRLESQFLVLEGRHDSLIPDAARARFRDAVPEPKTVETLEGDHMGVGPEKQALLDQVVAASKSWLIDKGAVTPF